MRARCPLGAGPPAPRVCSNLTRPSPRTRRRPSRCPWATSSSTTSRTTRSVLRAATSELVVNAAAGLIVRMADTTGLTDGPPHRQSRRRGPRACPGAVTRVCAVWMTANRPSRPRSPPTQRRQPPDRHDPASPVAYRVLPWSAVTYHALQIIEGPDGLSGGRVRHVTAAPKRPPERPAAPLRSMSTTAAPSPGPDDRLLWRRRPADRPRLR